MRTFLVALLAFAILAIATPKSEAGGCGFQRVVQRQVIVNHGFHHHQAAIIVAQPAAILFPTQTFSIVAQPQVIVPAAVAAPIAVVQPQAVIQPPVTAQAVTGTTIELRIIR